jgi:hypothetical protein
MFNTLPINQVLMTNISEDGFLLQHYTESQCGLNSHRRKNVTSYVGDAVSSSNKWTGSVVSYLYIRAGMPKRQYIVWILNIISINITFHSQKICH